MRKFADAAGKRFEISRSHGRSGLDLDADDPPLVVFDHEIDLVLLLVADVRDSVRGQAP